ncbi:MAG TPA: MFS transporter [Streptosporangiaceae bacterium]
MILGLSVAGIDSTVVAVALPAIGRNLHAGFQDLQWTVTSYTLTLAALILLAGSLSDRWGRRRVFLAGLGWFTLASVLCAAAPGIGWLIAARAVRGIGGALMTPASLAIIEAAFQPGDRTHAIGTWAGFSGVSSAIAPFLGGWLLEAGSWRWIFLINVPIAAAVAWMTQRHVPESRNTSLSGSADWPGALAGVAALGHDHLRDHRSAWRGRQVAGVRRCRGPGPAVLGHLRRHQTAPEPSHAPAGDLPPGAVPRRECRHLRRQRRPRRIRVRVHPRP